MTYVTKRGTRPKQITEKRRQGADLITKTELSGSIPHQNNGRRAFTQSLHINYRIEP